jgi:hypothetical protein
MRPPLMRPALFMLALLSAMPAAARDVGYTEEPWKGEMPDPNAMPGLAEDAPAMDTPSIVDSWFANTKESAPVEEVSASEPPPAVAPEAKRTPKSNPKAKATRSHNRTPMPATPEDKPVARDIPLIEGNQESSSHPDVSFVTGGVGEEERVAIEAAKPDYNLHITNTAAHGAFVGEARVVLTRTTGADGAGEEMLSVTSGPLLYVRLPAGSYRLLATLGEQRKEQSFTLQRKGRAVNVQLGWKARE